MDALIPNPHLKLLHPFPIPHFGWVNDQVPVDLQTYGDVSEAVDVVVSANEHRRVVGELADEELVLCEPKVPRLLYEENDFALMVLDGDVQRNETCKGDANSQIRKFANSQIRKFANSQIRKFANSQ